MKRDSFYTLLSHTADLGVIIKGDSCEELFQNAALALTDIMILNRSPAPGINKDVFLKGYDLADLMVKWLSEILYFFEGEHLITTEITINHLDHNSINASLLASELDEKHHEILRVIKAVTYHKIEVTEDNGCWKARVIFDL